MDANIADEVTYISAFRRLLDGLSHIYANAVVHRDLKHKNILVEKKPFFKVVITDFGLAKVALDNTLLTTFCETPKYVAPEVLPTIGYGTLADIWSQGIMVFEWIYSIPRTPTTPAL